MSCFLSPPITFLMPISFARLTDLAMVRFIKLIHAMSNINKAIPESM